MKILIVLMLISTQAFAHIKFGTYTGLNIDGTECSFKILQKTYFPNVRHPLNELVLVEVGSRNYFKLTHPVSVDKELLKVNANHDFLNGQNGDQDFSRSFSLKMSHEEGNAGPQAFSYFQYNKTTQEFFAQECLELSFKE